jgi:hypothetical protein
VNKRRSEEIRRVMSSSPKSTVRLGDILITLVAGHGKHQVVWIDYSGRVSEIDLGPRGARVLA